MTEEGEVRDIALIEWVDSQLHEGWRTLESIENDPGSTAASAGFLIHEDEESVVVASAVMNDGAAGVIRIPRRCIVSLTRRSLEDLSR